MNLPQSKKSIFSWALYDWANSAFATTVLAGFFPLFFKEYWADSSQPAMSTFYLGLANSIASIMIAVLAPFLGSIADRGTAKKRFLLFFLCIGVFMTSGLYLVDLGNWQLAAVFFVGGSLGFAGGNIFYDSLLPSITTEENVDKVSSLGFGLGYIGGGLLFAVNVMMFLNPELFGIADKAEAIKISFVSVGVWWALFSIPLFLNVKEPQIHASVSLRKAVIQGWTQLRETLNHIHHLKVVGLFLLAYWFYIDGVDTIVKMAVDYGMGIGFNSESLITALLIVQFVAFPSALVYGWLAGKIGAKTAILTSIAAYALITIGGALMQEEWHFYVLAISIGLFQGGIQALSRSLYTRLIPKRKAAQFFGFYNMLGKFAAVLGPVLMGGITVLTGNPRLGILGVLILFIIGFVLLTKVDVEEGKRMADAYPVE
ncbi:MAG: MFS transporter [Candidatus Marinimicrobia bacterium]|jgi:UMF1 family MFS transporter|nr:MFS transporter [Candidatus Neomarinimicrobiota bacterium]MBT3618343.1 MFS transporter [Candidatus Neomarinimicrobiota bacterium]MBT3829138.1 MFS transporter [Candidatus Neomarinimicrobiota bacterium]MBT3998106.1 MFS transporter [Candidatus Neomarinimicrobiota bacterium]MBT4281447.1 MFS transporter [Candidatus Neomarinimicrobiota bacterium]